MPLANEAEIKRIIIKVYKALDDDYLEYTSSITLLILLSRAV